VRGLCKKKKDHRALREKSKKKKLGTPLGNCLGRNDWQSAGGVCSFRGGQGGGKKEEWSGESTVSVNTI